MKSRAILIVFFAVVLLLISCNPVLEEPQSIGIPSLPKALLGMDSARKPRTRSNSTDWDALRENYDDYYIVPQIAINYDYFVGQFEDFLMSVSESESWVDIEDDDIFARQLFEVQTVELEEDSNLKMTVHLIVKESKDRSMLESHFFMNNPQVGNPVLTIRQHNKSSHAVMVRFPNYGPSTSTDVIEIWQSDKVTLTKCVRTTESDNYENNFFHFFHFISLTDRTSGDNHTIGIAKENETIASLDNAESGESFNEYGYFTDSELKNRNADPSLFPNLEFYEDFIFTHGITGKLVGELTAQEYIANANAEVYDTTQNLEFITSLDWEEASGTLDEILKL